MKTILTFCATVQKGKIDNRYVLCDYEVGIMFTVPHYAIVVLQLFLVPV